MSHKDPITGCIVADTFEVVTPKQYIEILTMLDNDSRREEAKLSRKNTLIHYLNRAIEEQNRESIFFDTYSNPNQLEYLPVANITKIVRVINIKYKQSFKESSNKIEAIVIANGIYQKVHFSAFWYAGDFYEPPSDEYEIYLQPL